MDKENFRKFLDKHSHNDQSEIWGEYHNKLSEIDYNYRNHRINLDEYQQLSMEAYAGWVDEILLEYFTKEEPHDY